MTSSDTLAVDSALPWLPIAVTATCSPSARKSLVPHPQVFFQAELVTVQRGDLVALGFQKQPAKIAVRPVTISTIFALRPFLFDFLLNSRPTCSPAPGVRLPCRHAYRAGQRDSAEIAPDSDRHRPAAQNFRSARSDCLISWNSVAKLPASLTSSQPGLITRKYPAVPPADDHHSDHDQTTHQETFACSATSFISSLSVPL